jgi:hypothetical protein
VKFREANLTAANLGLNNLGGATSLQGRKSHKCHSKRAKLSGAVFDKRTVFPEGFDPIAAGMALKGES